LKVEGLEVLVTGGAGFIGSHLVDRLVELGCRVTVIDNLSSGKVENIAHRLGRGARLVKADVRDPSAVLEAARGCSLIFHEAALVGVKRYVENPVEVIEVNVMGTRNVLEAARKLDVERLILASTSEVYGKNMKAPLSEDDDRLLGPTYIDRWCYSTSKALDEHLAMGYFKLYGLKLTVLRYFNVYGPRQECSAYGTVVPRFIAQALAKKPLTVFGTGRQTRCFTYVDDIVEGTVAAARIDEAVGSIINLGSMEETAIIDLAHLIIRLAGVEGLVEPTFIPYEQFYGKWYEDLPRRVPDTSKALKLLGFKPRISLVEGLSRTIEWYRHNPSRLAELT
jgi:UDP-glucose 4-epimerase